MLERSQSVTNGYDQDSRVLSSPVDMTGKVIIIHPLQNQSVGYELKRRETTYHEQQDILRSPCFICS